MKSRTIVFTEAYQAEILEKEVPALGRGDVLWEGVAAYVAVAKKF